MTRGASKIELLTEGKDENEYEVLQRVPRMNE